MTSKIDDTRDPHPLWQGEPVYGYDTPGVQQTYVERDASVAADFLLPHLQPGMKLLDCGCGPGTITLGLAQVVAPGSATGIDIESGMVEQAKNFATERNVANVQFQAADITDLPFENDSFDAGFSSAVLEHLGEPVKALREILRVVKPGAVVGVLSTDWAEPMISPANAHVSRFFEIFEAGFNDYGGSLNRGRHLRSMMREAGFNVTEFSASYGNSANTEAVQAVVNGYIDWMDNLPLFPKAIEQGRTTKKELTEIQAGMKEWAALPDAFLATTRFKAIGRK